jgi:hypothetical protein
MRERSYLLMFILFVLAGCSSPPRFTVDKEIWFGEASGGTQKVFVRVTFAQNGEAVEGKLELGPSETTLTPTGEMLTGSLLDKTLSVSTASSSESVTGTFQDETNFSGKLILLIEDVKDEFILTMTYQKTQ